MLSADKITTQKWIAFTCTNNSQLGYNSTAIPFTIGTKKKYLEISLTRMCKSHMKGKKKVFFEKTKTGLKHFWKSPEVDLSKWKDIFCDLG